MILHIKITLLLTTCSLMFNGQSISEQIKANNTFGIDLYKYVFQDSVNLCISPFSVSVLFAQLYTGAKDETKEEIKRFLNFPEESNVLNQSFKFIIEELEKSREEYVFKTYNAIWLHKEYKFKNDFIQNCIKYYNTVIEYANFSDSKLREKTRLKINTSVAEHTDNLILDFLGPRSIDELTKIVLVNTTYFKAKWENIFDINNFEEASFYGIDGKSEKMFMKNTGSYKYSNINQIEYIEIPYENDASLLIFLPKNEIFNIIDELYNKDFFNKYINNAEYKLVSLSLPKFNISSSLNLGPILYYEGMRQTFGGSSDFEEMIGEDTKTVKIDDIVHKTHISIDEYGTVAAAASAAVSLRKFKTKENAIQFVADHPFMFLIKENSTNSILFIGQLVK